MVEASEIIDILREHATDEEAWYFDSPESDYWHWGTTRQRTERIAAVAEYAAQHFGGDLVEIGAERGITTERLAQVAQRWNRTVIVIDPWNDKIHPGSEQYYADFLERMQPYKDILEVRRADSRNPKVIDFLAERPLCFAFVDGLHTYDACLSDIKAVYHAGIICVDDIQNNWKMLRAFIEGAGERRKLAHPFCKEKYIL